MSNSFNPPQTQSKIQLQSPNFQCAFTLKGHTDGVSDAAWTSSTLLATCSSDSSIVIWNGHKLRPSNKLVGHTAGISQIQWISESILGSVSDDSTLKLWDVRTNKCVRTIRGHTNAVTTLAVHPRKSLLISGSADECLRVWDIRTGTCLRLLPGHVDPVTTVTFSNDGTLFASGSQDGLIRMWDSSSCLCLKTLITSTCSPVLSYLKFSFNDKYLYASSLDSTIRMWEYSTSRCVRTISNHVSKKYHISFDTFHQGKDHFLISGSEAKEIIISKIENKSVHSVLNSTTSAHPHSDIVFSICCHSTLPIFCSTSRDKTCKVWRTQ